MALAYRTNGRLVTVRANQAYSAESRALFLRFTLVARAFVRKSSRGADFCVHLFEFIPQSLTLGPQTGEHVLAVGHNNLALNLIIACGALQDLNDGFVGRRDSSLVD